MPNSLKRSPEPETFELGKAITFVISRTKELNKEINGQLDQLEYIKARKKQEESDLERIIEEKSRVIGLKDELTRSIIEKKSEFLTFVGEKQTALEEREAILKQKEDNYVTETERANQSLLERQNELDRRSEELEKDKLNVRESVKREMRAESDKLVEREQLVETTRIELDKFQDELSKNQAQYSEDAKKLDEREQLVLSQLRNMESKAAELNVRENKVVEGEERLANTGKGISQALADMEEQLTLVKREGSKNLSDRKAIEDSYITLAKKKQELEAKELHLNDRIATREAHTRV